MKNQKLPAYRLEDETRAALRVSEAALHLGIQPQALRRRLGLGLDLEVFKVGQITFVKTDSLRRLLRVEPKASASTDGGAA